MNVKSSDHAPDHMEEMDEDQETTTGMNCDEPPPRLMITKMVLENFKSYAGVKEVGPFHKCFSSVVGPNGSGKSNVIDAMLFVFGKRAKKLRLNKVSELIHKSDAVKDDPPTFARVSVHFQEIVDTGNGDDDYRVLPDTETIVTRIAKQDSSSTYRLNGKNSSFKEIANYLNAKGIDLDNNRFLILQGEVEMISMMPPKGKTENDEGLLEYLEDIIGSSKFVEATNEAADKVEALTEVRQEKLNRVKAVEKEKDNLEGAKQEAEALLHKEREIRRKQGLLFQIHAMKAEKEHAQLSEKKENVCEQLVAARQALAASNQRIEEIGKGLAEQRRDYEITFEELKRTKEEFSAFERKDIKLREEINHERVQKKKLQDKIKAEAKKETAAMKKREAASARIPQLEEEIVELTERKAEEDAKLDLIEDETKAATQKIRRDLEAKTQELAPIKQERAVLQAALDTAETELKILSDASDRAKERFQSAEKEQASIDSTKEMKRKEIVEKEHEIQSTKETIFRLEKEDEELEKGEVSLEKRHADLVNDIEDAKSAMRSNEGGKVRSKAVQGILKAARKGGELSKVGILGRLGDLATIPEKYDIAISTACGGMLDNIVVQTTAGAQRCLEFLRKYNLGRASFIPLDKQKKGAHDRAVETPENASRLFDLIVPSNFAVTPALYLAVGNTLVAPDMDTASRWAYESSKRWRVVTLGGNLIETTGTMSGGGKTARSGGMRLANSRKVATVETGEDPEVQVEKLEAEAKNAQQLLHQCRKRRLAIKTEIRSLLKTVRGLEVAIPKLKLEIEGCETTRTELRKLIPDLKAQCELNPEDEAKKVDLGHKVQECKDNMNSCVGKANKLEAEVTKLQRDILEAGGSRLKKQKSLCEKLVSDLNAAEKLLTTSRVEITSADKAEAKASAIKDDLEESLRACDERLEEKEAEFKTLESGAMEVMTAYEKVKAIEAEKRSALDEASKEVDELKKSQSEIRCKEVDLVGQLDAIEKQLSDSKKKIHHWKKEVARIREEDDGYDYDDVNDEEKRDSMAIDGNDNIDGSQPDGTEQRSNSDTSTSIDSLPHEVLEKYDAEDIKESISTLEAERNSLAKNANMGAIAEYRKKEADYLARVAELDQVTEERNAARKEHEELRRQRLEMFMDGFGTITLKLKEMYQMITLGGDAELELVDSLDPFSEGIVFSVRPPKKSWKNISNLSGGEKTLSSLSLVFALHHYKPTPLYVMDEIDAALDFKNVSIVANYIKERTKNAQFIIISLRNNMFELADRLVGIYKTNNCTKSVTINPRAFGLAAQQNGALADRSNASMHASNMAGKSITQSETSRLDSSSIMGH